MEHTAPYLGMKADVKWIETTEIDRNNVQEAFEGVDGIIVPGGFGETGIEGKIMAIRYAREHGIPYLGLCLGLQVALIAAARNSGLIKANSTEFDPSTSHPVVHTMVDQKGKENTGGSMRLGDYPCNLQKGSLARKVYGHGQITERHRHRYEANNRYRQRYEKWGLTASGLSPDGSLVEMVEARNHPFFITTQAHPEFRSRPNRPHPLFDDFIKTIVAKKAPIN